MARNIQHLTIDFLDQQNLSDAERLGLVELRQAQNFTFQGELQIIYEICWAYLRQRANRLNTNQLQYNANNFTGGNVAGDRWDHAFEIQYCAKLFVLCVRKLQVNNARFQPKASDYVWVNEICNAVNNLFRTHRRIDREKTAYMGAGAWVDPFVALGTPDQQALVGYLDRTAAPFRVVVETVRGNVNLPNNIHGDFRLLFCDALLLTPFCIPSNHANNNHWATSWQETMTVVQTPANKQPQTIYSLSQ